MMTSSEQAVALLQARGVTAPIEVAVILGTGLGALADGLEDPITVPYADLPGFPKRTLAGHTDRLVVGRQEGTRVAYLQGRGHLYETGDAAAMATPLEVMAQLGVHTLILTCAAGSTKADLHPGTTALITDHINFSGRNPLIGSEDGAQFVGLTDAYDKRVLRRLKVASVAMGVSVQEGVYMWFSGPSFETPAEIKMARLLGADLVGMSVVPEVILARRLALRVGAIAVVTNYGAGFSGGNPNHAETQDQALAGTIPLKRLIRGFLKTKEEAWGLQAKPDGR